MYVKVDFYSIKQGKAKSVSVQHLRICQSASRLKYEHLILAKIFQRIGVWVARWLVFET